MCIRIRQRCMHACWWCRSAQRSTGYGIVGIYIYIYIYGQPKTQNSRLGMRNGCTRFLAVSDIYLGAIITRESLSTWRLKVINFAASCVVERAHTWWLLYGECIRLAGGRSLSRTVILSHRRTGFTWREVENVAFPSCRCLALYRWWPLRVRWPKVMVAPTGHC